MPDLPEDFPVFPFVQELFEDLSLTLPSLGCRFEGTVPPNDLSAKARRTHLKNQLFLFFADLAQGRTVITVKFTLASGSDGRQEWCFLAPQVFTPEFAPENLPSWQPEFQRLVMAEGAGFGFMLPQGTPLQVGPPLDWRELFRLYGSPQAGHDMVQNFLRRSEALMSQLDEAVKSQNASECFRLAHTLKGAARGIYALPFSMAALKLEMAGRGGNLAEAANLMTNTREVWQELVAWYRKGEGSGPGANVG